MKNDKKLTERLNETGYPFQERCAEIVQKASQFGTNYIIKEYPFTFPRTLNSQLGVSGSIDVLTLHCPKDTFEGGHPWIIYTIECKKSKSGIKNWCFVKSNREGFDKKTYFILSKNNQDNPLDFKIELIDNDQIGFSSTAENRKSGTPLFIDIDDVVIVGYETNDLISSLNRSQEEKIYKSILQAIHGSRFIESKNPPVVKELNLTEDKINSVTYGHPINLLFVPIVVTTSVLWVASFSSSDVISGEIDSSKIKWEKRNWVLYDFGLPDYLQHNDYINRAVFIVNSGFFSEFIDQLNPFIR